MFNLFKKRETRAQKLQSIIERHVAFCVKAIDSHQKLIAASPDRSKAIIETFIFNNWACYYILFDQFNQTLPLDTDNATRAQLRHNIRDAISAESGNLSLISVETRFMIDSKQYCGENFLEYVYFQFDQFDSSVERHSTPPAISAAIRLAVHCGIGNLAITDFKAFEALRNESCFVFIALEDITKKEIKAYLALPK